MSLEDNGLRIRDILFPPLSCLLATLLASCASLPEQTYLKQGALSAVDAVMLRVSAKDLDVSYSRDLPPSALLWGAGLLFSLLGLVVATTVETNVRAAKDTKLAEGALGKGSESHIERVLRSHFHAQLLSENVFKRIGLTDESESKDREKLLQEGYQALIELRITELSLRRLDHSDRLSIHLMVSGRMIDLRTDQVVWDRYEGRFGDQIFTVDQLVDVERLRDSMDQMIATMADRLVADLIYAK